MIMMILSFLLSFLGIIMPVIMEKSDEICVDVGDVSCESETLVLYINVGFRGEVQRGVLVASPALPPLFYVLIDRIDLLYVYVD
jgi:hypothetical protein